MKAIIDNGMITALEGTPEEMRDLLKGKTVQFTDGEKHDQVVQGEFFGASNTECPSPHSPLSKRQAMDAVSKYGVDKVIRPGELFHLFRPDFGGSNPGKSGNSVFNYLEKNGVNFKRTVSGIRIGVAATELLKAVEVLIKGGYFR